MLNSKALLTPEPTHTKVRTAYLQVLLLDVNISQKSYVIPQVKYIYNKSCIWGTI